MFQGFTYQSYDGLVDKPSWSSLSFKRKEKAELLLRCSKDRREGGHSSIRRLRWQRQLPAFLTLLLISAHSCCSDVDIWRIVLVKRVRKVAGIGEGKEGTFLIQVDPCPGWWCLPWSPMQWREQQSVTYWRGQLVILDRNSQNWRHQSCPPFEPWPGSVSPLSLPQELRKESQTKNIGTSRGDSFRGNLLCPKQIVSTFSFQASESL